MFIDHHRSIDADKMDPLDRHAKEVKYMIAGIKQSIRAVEKDSIKNGYTTEPKVKIDSYNTVYIKNAKPINL